MVKVSTLLVDPKVVCSSPINATYVWRRVCVLEQDIKYKLLFSNQEYNWIHLRSVLGDWLKSHARISVDRPNDQGIRWIVSWMNMPSVDTRIYTHILIVFNIAQWQEPKMANSRSYSRKFESRWCLLCCHCVYVLEQSA